MTENKALAILGWVQRIAMVGASADPSKASYRVLKDLTARGYEVIPVNPRPGLTEIDGIKAYPTLKDIEQPIDMVDVFRPPAELPAIARQAIDINAKVLWMQLGIKNNEAEEVARAAGLEVIMDRCPSIELAK